MEFVRNEMKVMNNNNVVEKAYLIFVTDTTDGVCVNFFWPV